MQEIFHPHASCPMCYIQGKCLTEPSTASASSQCHKTRACLRKNYETPPWNIMVRAWCVPSHQDKLRVFVVPRHICAQCPEWTWMRSPSFLLARYDPTLLSSLAHARLATYLVFRRIRFQRYLQRRVAEQPLARTRHLAVSCKSLRPDAPTDLEPAGRSVRLAARYPDGSRFLGQFREGVRQPLGEYRPRGKQHAQI